MMIQSSGMVIRFEGAKLSVDTLDALSEMSGDLCVFVFGPGPEADEAGPLTDADADLHHRIVNLPASGRLTLAVVDRPLAGRDLALALHCTLVAVTPQASFSSGFGQPGSAAVYAAAAARVGARACEALLFGSESVGASRAVEAGLVSFAAVDAEAAMIQAQVRLATMLCVAKANLITWPFSRDAAVALVDP